IWIPAQVACFAYPPYRGEEIFGFTASVGLAAGFSAEEASVHGLYEFIERDTLNVRWGLDMPPREITDVPWAEVCPELSGHPLLSNPAYEFSCYDWSLDLPDINCMAVHLVNKRLDKVSYYAGMTASVDPMDAIRSSTAELSQGIRFLPLYSYLKKQQGYVPKFFKVERDSPIEEVDNLFKTMLYYGFSEHRERLRKGYLSRCEKVSWDDFKNEWKHRKMPKSYEEHHKAIRASFKSKGWDPVITDITPKGFKNLRVVKSHVMELTPYTIIHMMAGHPRYEQIRRDFRLQDRPFEYEQFNKDAIPYP
ncbi:MAG: YcaO-like family protein, partial [Methanobacteriota archaeon]